MSSSDNLPVELEQQFILRLPQAPASTLRETLKSGTPNLKDRMKLKLDPEMRYGTLFLDHYVLPTKLVDLPCIIESHKTIDKKVIYKTADICQMLLCKEEEDEPQEEEQSKLKKKDNKVDKKFIWPHGITPPLKNVRKRRFRKVLKKKQYLDQPEIEKEVRRLFREDYEAHHVRWEVIDEEEDKTKEGGGKDVLMQGSKTNEPQPKGRSRIAAEDLFGGLSDSEGEDADLDEDESRISLVEDDDSRLSDSEDSPRRDKSGSGYPTSFSKDMFATPGPSHGGRSKSPDKKGKQHRTTSSSSDLTSMSRGELQSQLSALKQRLTEISTRRSIQEIELSTTDNAALKGRLEMAVNKLANDQREKEREIRDIEMLLNQMSF